MATSLNASLNVTLNPASLNSSTKQVRQALGRITGQASEFQKSLDASTARVFAFGATTAVLNGVSQAFKKLVATTVEVQKRLVEINSIFKATETAFNRFRNAIFRVAQETGQSFSTVAEGAAELARQGLSAAETANRLKAALVLTRISGMDAEKSVKALTAAINGFTSAGLTANQIVNKMVAVDTAFAVSTQDLAEAFSRAGSTAEDAGVSFNELLGLVTAVEQRTARGGAVIGNAFKSIFTRLSRGSTIEELKALGVAIDATQSGIQKLQALSKALDNISDPTVASKIKELAGGVFQINVVSAALKDLGSDTSVFKNAALTAANATNEAFEKNVGLNKTISAQMNSLVQGLTGLAERIGSITFGPLLEGLLGIAGKFTTFLDKALDPEKGNEFIKGFFKAIGSFLGGPAIILVTAAIVKITKLIAKFAIEGLKALFQIGTQVEKIKQIEGGIVGLLGRDVALRKVITSATATQAQKEQAVIAAIQRENALLTQQAALMRQLAIAAAARGVRGSSGGALRFNAGFRAEEAEAQMRGAPAGVRGRYSAGTIGGKKFIMNNRETEVPNFGKNGDSAVIPHYAGGFVPNYANYRLGGKGAFLSGAKVGKMSKKDQARAVDSSGNVYKKGAKRRAYGSSFPEYNANLRPPPTAVMLVPQKMTYSSTATNMAFNSIEKRKQTGYRGFLGGAAGIDPNLKRDSSFARLLNLDKILDASLTRGVNAALAVTLRKSGGKLKAVPKKFTSKQVKSKLLKEGGAGAFGSLRGAIFESIIDAITGGVKAGTGNNTLDVNIGGNKAIEEIFGLPKGQFAWGDFKNSSGQKSKFVDQVIRSLGQTKKGKAKKKGKAAGFIPNFARDGLGEAIEREKNAGVPTNKIRAHFDENGMPIAVTNTKDEGNGLKDVRRAAGGFIPNYAKGEGGMGMGGLMMGLFALQGVLGTLTATHEQVIAKIQAEIEERNSNIDVLKIGLSASREQRAINQKLLTSKEEENSAVMKFTKQTQAATQALMALATVNMLTGGGLGKGLGALAGLGTKGRAAWGAARTQSGVLQARGVGKWSARARAYGGARAAGNSARIGSIAGRGGLLGKAAGRFGAIGAVGVGAMSAWNTYKDKDLHKSQKKERYTKTAVKTGFTAAGAALGTLIPIPVLGTLVGGAIGSWMGGLATGGESKADKKREEAKGKAREHVGKIATLGFDVETFDARAMETIRKMEEKEAGTGLALAERANSAREKSLKLAEKVLAGETVNNEEQLAADQELIASSMALANAKHRNAKRTLDSEKRMGEAEERLSFAQAILRNAKLALAKKTLDAVKLAEEAREKASLRVDLKSAISGPYAGAVGLASEENLMQQNISVARAERIDAERKYAGSMGTEDEEKNKKAMEDAGAFFKEQVRKAGVSFLTSIKRTQDLLKENRKKMEAVKKSEFTTTQESIEKLQSGETGGDIAGFWEWIKIAKKEKPNYRQDVTTETDLGPETKTAEYTKEELTKLNDIMREWTKRYKEVGYTGDPMDIMKDLAPNLARTMTETAGQRRRVLTSMDQIADPEEKMQVEDADKAQREREGQTQNEVKDKLQTEQQMLIDMITNSRNNFENLLTEEDTKAMHTKLSELHTAMDVAATGYNDFAEWVKPLLPEVRSMTGVITANKDFMDTAEAELKTMTARIEGVEAEIDDINRESDADDQTATPPPSRAPTNVNPRTRILRQSR